jgi:putative ABC transport system permease protein
MVEAIVLSVSGGLMGIAVGVASSYVLGRVMQWPTVVTSGAVLLAFGFAVAVGVFFGFYPARKAAVLNPIEALRYE